MHERHNIDARRYTNQVIELAEEGVLSWETIAREALSYMPESEVEDMATGAAGWIEEEDED